MWQWLWNSWQSGQLLLSKPEVSGSNTAIRKEHVFNINCIKKTILKKNLQSRMAHLNKYNYSNNSKSLWTSAAD